MRNVGIGREKGRGGGGKSREEEERKGWGDRGRRNERRKRESRTEERGKQEKEEGRSEGHHCLQTREQYWALELTLTVICASSSMGVPEACGDQREVLNASLSTVQMNMYIHVHVQN